MSKRGTVCGPATRSVPPRFGFGSGGRRNPGLPPAWAAAGVPTAAQATSSPAPAAAPAIRAHDFGRRLRLTNRSDAGSLTAYSFPVLAGLPLCPKQPGSTNTPLGYGEYTTKGPSVTSPLGLSPRQASAPLVSAVDLLEAVLVHLGLSEELAIAEAAREPLRRDDADVLGHLGLPRLADPVGHRGARS